MHRGPHGKEEVFVDIDLDNGNLDRAETAKASDDTTDGGGDAEAEQWAPVLHLQQPLRRPVRRPLH